MLKKELAHLSAMTAGDGTALREILHPDRDATTVRCSLAHATVPPGGASLKHSLTAAEVYYFISGRGVMHVGGEQAAVSRGTTILVPENAVQWLENTGTAELEFLCLVDPAWQESGEEILE